MDLVEIPSDLCFPFPGRVPFVLSCLVTLGDPRKINFHDPISELFSRIKRFLSVFLVRSCPFHLLSSVLVAASDFFSRLFGGEVRCVSQID